MHFMGSACQVEWLVHSTDLHKLSQEDLYILASGLYHNTNIRSVSAARKGILVVSGG